MTVSDDEPAAVAVAFYSRRDYALLRVMATDPTDWCDSYDKYLEQFEQAVVAFQLQGTRTELIRMDTMKLVDWCRRKGRSVDPTTSAEYAMRVLAERRGVDNVWD